MIRKSKVIVIGAGVAGLTAAQLLQRSGCEVMILEGTNRVGGRVFSVQLEGKYIDVGATWIHFQKGNSLTKFVKSKGLKIIEDNYEPFAIWNQKKEKWIGEKQFKYMLLSEATRKAAINYTLKNNEVLSANDFFQVYIQNKNWRKKTTKAVRFLYNVLLETDYGGNVRQIALTDERYLDKYKKNEENDGLIVGGFKPFIDELRRGLDIRLNEVVQNIDYQKEKVRITTSTNTYECDQVIVTVSLGVLKQGNITFLPTLSAQKKEAIQSFQFGKLEKIVLTFERKFWGSHQFIYNMNTEKPLYQFPMILDFSENAQTPTLGIYYAADFAEYLQTKTDDFILEKVLSTLKNMFKKDFIQPTNYYISRWSNNPFFRGAYSFSSDFNLKSYIKTLSKPIDNKVFFAGEATSIEGQAYVHGAFLSGIREAKRLGITEKVLFDFFFE